MNQISRKTTTDDGETSRKTLRLQKYFMEITWKRVGRKH